MMLASPAVLWSADEKTLYFIYEENPVDYEETHLWGDHHVDKMWAGWQVLETGWNYPDWSRNDEVNSNLEKVVFDESFAQVRPKSLYCWFCEMTELEAVEGIENLNTSETTNMNSTFYGCSKLTALDLNGFDVSKVTNATAMFRACANLTTIYCDKTWDIPTAEAMFTGATKLVGAVPFVSNQDGVSMANPVDGYFTGKWDITIPEFEHGQVVSEKDWAYTNEVVTLTVNPDEGYRLESITVETVADGQPGRAPGKAPQRVNIDVNMGESPGIYTFTMPAAKVIVNATFEKESITEIDAIQADTEGDGLWYTLDGRVLRDKPTTPGIYLHGKSKIRIR